jgi:AraC-like DNA-binding protein
LILRVGDEPGLRTLGAEANSGSKGRRVPQKLKSLRDPQRLIRALDTYLRVRAMNTFSGRVTVSEFAASLNKSVSYLERIFRQVLGQTVLEALRIRQLAQAEELLRSTSKSIREIALLSGFGTQATFYRVFSRLRGMTPDEYRAKFTK